MTGEEEDPFVEPMVNLSPPTPTAAAAAAAEPTSDRSVMNDISVSGGGGIPDQHHGVDRSAPNSLSSAHRQLTQRLNAHATARWHIMTIDSLRRRALLNTSSHPPPAGTGSSMAMTMGQQVVRGNNNNINIGIGQYNNFNNNMGPRRPPLRMMLPTRSMLPPLEPKPMPNQEYYVDNNDVNNSTSSTVGNNDDDEEDKKTNVKADLKKFECAICFEYMDYPVGCGSCQTRFCRECLQRVLRQASSSSSEHRLQQQSDVNPPNFSNSGKCPHCRSIFTLQSIVIDTDLRKEICDCMDTVTCAFRGCGTELRIGLLKSHEASCPHMRMRCRYADWGCDWVGQRKFIEDHDAHQCEFRGGLGKLVERFRQNNHIIRHHHMQIAATSQMMSIHSRQLMLVRSKNVGNVFDIFHLAYEASLFPGRLFAMREGWISLCGQHDAQCVVCNILLLVPSMTWIFKEGLHGIELLTSVQLEKLSGDDLWLLAETLLQSLIIVMLGILCISCFFIDTKSPHEWTTYNVRSMNGQLLRDIASICMAMAYALTFNGGLHPGFILWQSTAIVTVLYTSFVSCIIAKSYNSPSTASTMRAARAWSVVIFGLRYGFLAGIFGFVPGINAVVTMRLLKHTSALSAAAKMEDAECFIQQFSTSLLIAISGFATAFEYATTDADEISWLTIVLDWMLATIALAYANALVFILDEAGRRLGEKNFMIGMQARQASGVAFPNIKPTPIGCSICGVCSFLLLFIATASTL